MTKTEIKTGDDRWKMKMNMMLKIKMEMMDCHGRETERRKVSERQRFMRRRRACAVGRSCLAFVASEPIDDRGREASDCGSRAGARDDGLHACGMVRRTSSRGPRREGQCYPVRRVTARRALPSDVHA